jgi:hypothetical protein
MKQLRLVCSSLALVAAFASHSSACDKEHSATTASAKKSHKAGVYTASMAACMNKSTATTAATAARCPGMLGVAVFANASGGASKDACCMSKSAATAAVTAANTEDHCGSKSATTASSGKSKVTAVFAGAGGQCSSRGVSNTSARMAHADCDACADMLDCENELQTAGTRVQMVPLKNGVMFMYTASSPGKVNALQSSLARRTERLNQIVSSAEKARLCAECKSMRGAMASGKLNREVVNIEGGALTLMTSSDPVMVSKIYSMVDLNTKVARKS